MKKIFAILLVFSNVYCYSQITEPNYYHLIQSMDSFYNANPGLINNKDEDGDFAQYSKFKDYFSSRIDENGSFFRGSTELMSYLNLESTRSGGCNTVLASWNNIGPTKIGSGSQNNGRIDAIAINPIDNNIIYAGSNTGGLWKTTNANSTTPIWQNKTDGFLNLSVGIENILLLPSSPNVIYVATGTFLTYGVGVICTYDGGDTWHKTGLSFNVNEWEQVAIKKLIYIPSSNANDTTLIAITRTKIWRTHNGKPSLPWDEVYNDVNTYPLWQWDIDKITVDFSDLEVDPINSNIVYACGRRFVKSIDGGITWSDISSNIENSGAFPTGFLTTDYSRYSLSIANDGLYVMYFIVSNANTVIRNSRIIYSNDGGLNWSLQGPTVTPNLSDYYNNFNNLLYNDNFIVPYNNSEIFYSSAVEFYKYEFITNDILSFFNVGSNHYKFTGHDDVRCFKLYSYSSANNTDVLYAGNDGGVSKSEDGGATWQSLNGSSLVINQYFGFANTELDRNLQYGGAQDNGTLKLSNSVWTHIQGGDGGDCLIDFDNSNDVYDQYNYHVVGPGGLSTYCDVELANCNDPNQQYFNLSPIVMAETKASGSNYYQVYGGWNDIFKTDDGGNTWNKITTNSERIKSIALSKSNFNVAYNCSYGHSQFNANSADNWGNIYKTTNFQSINPTWTNINYNLKLPENNQANSVCPLYHADITSIVVDPLNENRIWITFGNFYDANKIYFIDLSQGNPIWVNETYNLPNFPVNCMIYQNGTNDRLYIGTDVGVFIKDANETEWKCFNEGLPVCVVTDLQINYCAGLLDASTWGRGMWETSLIPIINENELPTLISANATWTGDVRINTNIEIEGGATLTISNADVSISPLRKIYVKRGGRLIIDNSTLTNKCDEQWDGIYIYGNPQVAQPSYAVAHASTYPPSGTPVNQYPFYSGVLIVKNNSVIEHTNGVAVNNCEGDYNWSWGYNINNSGGLIYADNSTFQDNFKDAAFMQYGYTDHSKFTECNFIANAYTLDHGLNTKDFVSMWDVHGTSFAACNFQNNAALTPKFRGIFSIDADYNVTGKCLTVQQICDPCSNMETSNFESLDYGIYSLASIPEYPLNPITIRNCEFNLNDKGILLSAINRSVVKSNEFIIPSTTSNLKAYGLYVEACNQFTVEENNFHSGLALKNAGAYFANCNSQTNIVYRNEFTKLETGLGAIGNNIIRSTIGQNGGLFIKCNNFSQCTKQDIGVFTIDPIYGYSYVYGGIPDQGYCSNTIKTPAGNTFSIGAAWNIYKSNDAFDFWYYHHNVAGYIPLNVSLGIHTDNCSGYDLTHIGLDCAATPCGHKLQLAKILQRREEYETLNVLINGGNKGLLMLKIKDPNTSSAMLKMYLIAAGPYLTDSVIISSIDRTYPMVAQDLADVVLNNSPIKDTVFAKLLSKRPAVASDIQVLLAQLPPQSSRDILAKEMMSINAEKDLLIDEAVTHFVEAETTDSIEWLMNEIGEPDRLMGYYLNKHDYNSATEIISGFNDGEESVKERNNYLSLLLPYMMDTTTTDTVTADDVEQIRTFASDMNAVSYSARNWLEYNKQEITPEYIPVEDSVTVRMETKFPMLPNFISSIYPNPSTDFIWIKLKEETDEINPTLTDLNGRTVNKNFNLLSTGYFKLDVTDLADGIYFIDWRNNNGLLVDRNKITVIH